MYDAEAGHPLPARGPEGTQLELVLVGEARLTTDQPTLLKPTVTLEMHWADGIALAGYSLDSQTLDLTLYWQATDTPSQDYTVFVHLLDESEAPRGQRDGPPVGGDYPTSLWIPGELVEDSYPILFPANAPPGPYRVFLGLYDEATLARLPVPTDTEGRVILNVE